MEIEIEIDFHFQKLRQPYIILDYPEEEFFRKATWNQIEECPAQFRCFLCSEKRSRKHFVGTILKQRICGFCADTANNWIVGGLIRYDLRHGFSNYVREY